jgi:DnaK suppressor protein
MLLVMRKGLLQEVSQSMRSESDHLKHDIGDFYDHASNDRDRELALMLADREREKLTYVDNAIRRIENKTYGICESCDEVIDKERLIAMPFTKLCLSCQEDLERG